MLVSGWEFDLYDGGSCDSRSQIHHQKKYQPWLFQWFWRIQRFIREYFWTKSGEIWENKRYLIPSNDERAKLFSCLRAWRNTQSTLQGFWTIYRWLKYRWDRSGSKALLLSYHHSTNIGYITSEFPICHEECRSLCSKLTTHPRCPWCVLILWISIWEVFLLVIWETHWTYSSCRCSSEVEDCQRLNCISVFKSSLWSRSVFFWLRNWKSNSWEESMAWPKP